MTLVFASIGISYLLVTQIFKPVLQYNAWKSRRDYEEEFRYYQLRVVKEFYPVLRKMSLQEIDERYGLRNVYESVGREYLRDR